MTEKLLLLSDPSLTEGIKTAEQDCPELRVLSASVRPRDCGPRAPLPRGFSTAPLCRGCCAVLQGASRHRGPFCRGCGALFVGGGAPDPGTEPSSPEAAVLRGALPRATSELTDTSFPAPGPDKSQK